MFRLKTFCPHLVLALLLRVKRALRRRTFIESATVEIFYRLDAFPVVCFKLLCLCDVVYQN